MNNWNRLLAVLDNLFGSGSGNNEATVRKVDQWIDNTRNETVTVFEYRVRIRDQSNTVAPKMRLLKQVSNDVDG